MPKDGDITRTKLLDAAQELILRSGFGGTSVDKVIEKAGVTKGTFFYHFESKADLAKALIDRFSAKDIEFLEDALRRAEKQSKDPLRQVLSVVDYFIDLFANLDQTYPGCLFACYVYEAQLFDTATMDTVADFAHQWRRRLAPKLREAMKLHPPKKDFDADEVADGLTVVFEGSMILSKLMKDPTAIAAHLRHSRRYVELLFDR